MFSRFFIHRPIFASVLSIIITLAGGIAMWTLPVAQYPEIAPPTVEVSASYPGADAKVVADTVAAPIEQQVNGVEGMLYMSSQCTNDGTYTLTVTFKLGVDLNMAQVLVQNRVAMAQPILPELVNRKGVTVKKKSPNVLMIVNLYSPKGTRDNLYLSNYATIQLRDELARLTGVGDITYLGQRDYSMRLWLDPDKMASRNLTASDVVAAVTQQNAQVAAGQIGQPPVPKGQVFQFTMTTLGRLADPEQFANMILKTDTTGRVVRMRDVARIELGAQDYDQSCTLDGRPSVALSIYQLPGSNALKVAGLVKDKMRELKRSFPEDLDYSIVYDTTPFISESVVEVRRTLMDAVLLVALVMLLFLQNWRSAVIPLVAVPVAIIGTFAVMAAMGFSLNNLTLFGLVLAIGIVVDDAIVVVEAVEYHIEHGLSPRDASIKAMSQVSGPVIAVGLVLAAVFLPCAFISGITGQFFRQFALTIATSTVISAFNSLTLSPALAAVLLRPREKGRYEVLPLAVYALLGGWAGYVWLLPWLELWLPGLVLSPLQWLAGAVAAERSYPMTEIAWWLCAAVAVAVGAIAGRWLARPLNAMLGRGFHLFNVGFDRTTNAYTLAVGMTLRVSVLVLLVYAGLLGVTCWGFLASPSGFIPMQDKGYLLVNVQLPDAASLERTQRVMRRIEDIALRDRARLGVDHTVSIAGQSILLGANAPNFGAMYVMLQDFHERAGKGLTADVIARHLEREFQSEIQGGLIHIFGAPPVEGLGTASGFKIILEDRGDNGLTTLQQVGEKIIDRGRDISRLTGLFSSFRADTPWLSLDIDRDQAKSMGISLTDIFNTLQVFLGSLYVNDFNRFGRTWQVNVQADADYRRRIEDLKQFKVRNATGTMVPLGSLATVREISGPVLIQRYNMYPSAPINGEPAPGVSSGEAIGLMQTVANQNLLRGMKTEWTELALLQIETGNTAMWVFLLAVILVFLVLAAQYESWSLPLAVILVVPMCLLFSIAGVALARMDINIFTQVGFVVLVGLACKNAILIVEFAKNQREAGQSVREATLAACKLRLRPIIMTSLAFIIGVVPLALAVGAGAEMRRTLGVAVFAGMLGVTLFGVFLTPVFYYVIEWASQRLGANDSSPSKSASVAENRNT
ncbi:MAG: efflux RND transporter permease subunit [Planctomycetaceae bacterium]|nr:efflux RND transporter permease subunit [Planctomycetaceae bacterium]